jgi:hypothetical protein
MAFKKTVQSKASKEDVNRGSETSIGPRTRYCSRDATKKKGRNGK